MKRSTLVWIIISGVLLFTGYRLNNALNKSITKFDAEARYVFNREEGNAKEEIKKQIREGELLQNEERFFRIADLLNVWGNVTPGRFEIKKGATGWEIMQTLKNNQQSNQVDFTIKKLQTKEGLSSIIGRRFLTDSASAYKFLTSLDSLAPLGVDTHTVFTLIIPDNFSIHYKSDTRKILEHFKQKSDSFWVADNRLDKVAQSGLTKKQFYILASIVEEESAKDDEKGNIASVYLNRMRRGMRLGADPTVKFALRRFDLRRILNEDLKVQSPYNTYVNSGLPPGPICTPSAATIDAMLPVPATNYLFFVAKDDFSGYHVFTTNYNDHLAFAEKYRKALDEQHIKR